jgi:DNA-binding MarR family transcriptional regulator
VVVLDDDMAQANAALGLTQARTHLLWELGQRGPVPQRVLAQSLKVTARAITGLVDALEAQGLVTREAHPTDRRATLVTLTPEGQTVVAQLKRDHKKLARALFASMPRDEFESFANGLTGVIGQLRTHLAATSGRSDRGSTSLDGGETNRIRN